jgi:transposase
MFSLTSSNRYYLYNSGTDMRKSFDSLGGLICNNLCRDASCGDVFLFINKSRNKIKLLHWERGGFVLYYKRLEAGTFKIPSLNGNLLSIEMDWPQLMMMVEGIEMQNVRKRKRYSPVKIGI